MYLVSACLLGMKTRFDGGSNFLQELVSFARKGLLIPVCPEQLGGLTTPRLPAEIQGQGGGAAVLNRSPGEKQLAVVVNKEGENVTEAFLKGARETLRLARLMQVKGAILKQGSPSCGSLYIYDGSFQKRKIEGMGVTAALLASGGFALFDEFNLPF